MTTGGAEAAGRAETPEACPWCGFEARFIPDQDWISAHGGRVECERERCSTGPARKTQDAAISEWNRVARAARSQAREAAELLKDAADVLLHIWRSDHGFTTRCDGCRAVEGIITRLQAARASAARIVDESLNQQPKEFE